MSLKVNEKEKMKIEETQSSKAKNYVVSTLFNTSLFVFMSFITKGINLLFNVLIARIITKESYGLATVYFNFIFMILLYFPRETMRKTCLKFCPDENEELENFKFKKACDLIWFMNFMVLICSIPIGLLFIFFGGSGESKISEFKIHIFLYILAAMIELIAEPAIIYLNIKIDKKYRLIGMTLSNYSRLILNYLFAFYLGFDLWSFTLSRLLASCCFMVYTIYVGLVYFKMSFRAFIPDLYGVKTIMRNEEIKILLNSFLKGTTLKMILNYSERIVLSFFLQISDVAKAEYTFIVENFSTFIRFIIEPAEENFYNLINKIKNYKDLTVIPSTGEDFSGDFSKSENEILIKLYSNLKKSGKKDKENYSFKLLKLSLKLFFVFGILLCSYLFLVGKDLVIYIFTEKWGTEHTICILKVYSLYVGVLAITSITEAYANAVCSSEKMHILNTLMTINAIILLSLSMFLAQYDITGLVWANIITLLIRFIYNLYLIISSELEDQINSTNNNTNNQDVIKDNKLSFDDEDKLEIMPSLERVERGRSINDCIKYTNILSEMAKFLFKSFMKTTAIISTLVCLIILNIIRELVDGQDSRGLLLFSAAIIFSLNVLLIFMVEKKGFLEIIRLKSNNLKF